MEFREITDEERKLFRSAFFAAHKRNPDRIVSAFNDLSTLPPETVITVLATAGIYLADVKGSTGIPTPEVVEMLGFTDDDSDLSPEEAGMIIDWMREPHDMIPQGGLAAGLLVVTNRFAEYVADADLEDEVEWNNAVDAALSHAVTPADL